MSEVNIEQIIESLRNYRFKLLDEIENIDGILKQPLTICHSEEYYEAQRIEKMKASSTINNIIKGTWIIDKKGNIVETSKRKEVKS